MKKLLIFLGVLLTIFAIYVTFFSPDPSLHSPLSSQSSPSISHLSPSTYIVLGFAPYWNLKKITSESLAEITHFAYFNLHLNGDGSLYSHVNRKEQDPGYTNFNRLIAGNVNYGKKPLILTFMPESQAALANSVSSSQNRQKTIQTIIKTMTDSHSTGVNIDYEPLGDISPSLRNNFTLFIKELRSSLDSNISNLSPILTISTYASAASKPRLWDLSALAPHTDYFVIMAYDYTMPTALSAGPNSPLRGSGDLFEHDIIKNIAEITKLVPSKKILLGIPLYGYEWDTIDESKYSPATSRGSVASLERIQKMLDDQTLSLLWDRNTLTPYGVATTSGQTSQIYFENETSIRLKLQFVKSANLGGIALWALGYEGSSNWLWPTIHSLNY